MKKGGLADSPFFSMPQPAEVKAVQVDPQEQSPTPISQPTARPIAYASKPKKPKRKPKRDAVTPRHHDTMLDTTIPRYHDTIIETVRKAVKEIGKEAATHRFTLEEKKAIADIIYAYKRQGIKSSENEIARIAINFIIADYEENGENSVLHKAIEALNK